MLQMITTVLMLGVGIFVGWKLHKNYISTLVVKNLMDVLDKKKSIVGANNVIQLVHRKKEAKKG